MHKHSNVQHLVIEILSMVSTCGTSCLQALLTDETISNVPVLILGNKIDRPEAISEDALRAIFGLQGYTTGKVMHLCIPMQYIW